MGLLSRAKMYARFALGLRGFLRRRISVEQARAIVRRRMAQREENFLRLVRKGIFGHPRSPYLPLMQLAGCEIGDLETMVRRRGLDGALLALQDVGQPFDGPGYYVTSFRHTYDHTSGLRTRFQAERGSVNAVS